MTRTELTNLIQQLIALGADKEELQIWLDIYDDIEPEEQAELTASLQRELESLKQGINSKTQSNQSPS